MRERQSQSHVQWYWRYHVVWVPKYRRRVIYGRLRRGIGKILRQLCDQHGIELRRIARRGSRLGALAPFNRWRPR